MSVSACFMVLAILAMRAFFKKVPNYIKCILWGLVGLRLVLPFTFESVLSLIPSAQTFPVESIANDRPVIHTGLAHLNTYVNPIIEKGFADPKALSPMSIAHIASIIWLAGVLVMVLICAYTYIRLRFKLNTAVKFSDNVYKSEFVSSPFVLGIIKPRIYLPFSISEQENTLALSHEKAHIKRGDHLIKPIAYLVLSLHWFNPLVWLAYALLSRDIELACDEKVIESLGKEGRAEYSKVLLMASENKLSITACPLAFGETGVSKRIKNILSYKKPTFWAVAIAAVLCIFIGVCFLTSPHTLPNDESLLNYFVFGNEMAKQEIVHAIYCPKGDQTTSLIRIGNVQGPAVKSFLDRMEWYEIKKPKYSLPSPESVEFILDDDIRLQLYRRGVATVKYDDDIRYYRIKRSDYEYAVNLIKAGSMAAKGVLGVEDCVYMSPLSSYLPIPPYREYYIIDGNSLIHVSEETGETYSFNNIVWDWQESSKKELESLIELKIGAVKNFDAYDTKGVLKQRITQNKFLYKVGDRFWLASTYETPKGDTHAMSIFSLKPTDEGLWLLTWDDLLKKIEDKILSWSDIGVYSRIETGSGLYVYAFDISENWSLMVSSVDPPDFENENQINGWVILSNRNSREEISLNQITDKTVEQIELIRSQDE